jgi:alkanesulfonate monooxygenase SsuD/methylene tetrahydromethanopterin reductase-like flavin-dependent oxidoreductase (luciferase family)
MDFGVMLPDVPLDVPARVHFDGVLRLVEAAQRNGMTYILLGQHFLFPEYRWLQPVPLLARLAGEVNPDVRLVTQVMIAPLYNPVLLAEELATLDVVSEGRLIVGLGLGYRTLEYSAFGIPFEQRARRMEECVAVMKELWAKERVTFSGSFWSLDDVPVHVRPVQEPRPPLWIGADSRAGVARAARIGDAWPIPPQVPLDQAERRLHMFMEVRETHGLPLSAQPMRREIVVGTNREDAIEKAVRMAGPQLAHMAGVNDTGLLRTKGDPMAAIVQRSFILGNPAECAQELSATAQRLPVNPVITRAGWPGMTFDDSVQYLDSLGAELIPSLKQQTVTASASA